MQIIKKSREEQVVRWARYVRSHPEWKRFHTEFINAQYVKYEEFLKRLLKSPGGKEKLRKLMNR